MAGNDDKKASEEKSKRPPVPLAERFRDLVQGILDDLQSLVNPPQPVRIPATGSRRPRYR